MRLIDADALKKVIHCAYSDDLEILDKIDNAPTVEERPKGKWIELPKSINDNELPCECSICGHVLGFYYGYPKSNFCPNCGADMRGNEI